MLRTGVDADGMGYGHWLLEPAQHARLMALIDANKDRIFHDARRAGVREPSEAYAADALAALADLPGAVQALERRDGGADRRRRRGGRRLVVRQDDRAGRPHRPRPGVGGAG